MVNKKIIEWVKRYNQKDETLLMSVFSLVPLRAKLLFFLFMLKFFIIHLCLATFLLAEDDRDPLVIRHADGFEYVNRGGEKVQKLTGRVEIDYKKAFIKSDTAIHYQLLDRIEFFNRVHLDYGKQKMNSDRLTYFKKDSTAHAKGRVELLDAEEHIRITGGECIYQRAGEHSRILVAPILTKIDSAAKETLTIVSEEMEHFGIEKKAVALYNVVITQAGTRATCDRAVFDQKEERLRLIGKPVVYHEHDVLKGDTIFLFFRKDTLTLMQVLGHAYGEFLEKDSVHPDSSQISRIRGDTLLVHMKNKKIDRMEVIRNADGVSSLQGDSVNTNRLTGRYMEFFFQKNVVDSVHVIGNATSVYYYSDVNHEQGKNETSGDTLSIFFSESRVSRILARGAIKGLFYER